MLHDDEMARPALFGTCSLNAWSGRRFQLYWAYHGRISAAIVNRFNSPPLFKLLYVDQGRVHIREAGSTCTVSDSTWLAPSLQRSEESIQAGSVVASICFDVSAADGSSLLAGLPTLQWPAAETPELLPLALRLHAWTARHRPPERRGERMDTLDVSWEDFRSLAALQLDWLDALRPQLEPTLAAVQSGEEPRAAVLRARLLAASARPFPSATELAAGMGVGWRRLEQLFIDVHGRAPRRFHDDERFRLAQSMLNQESTPIKEIALRLGFCDGAHFSTWFRRRARRSPSSFRLRPTT